MTGTESEKRAVTEKGPGSRAAVVAGGILSSRLMGFVRERVFAHYFGVGAYTDVLTTAFRGPNVLQVLLGEQSLSASFIPIYARLLEEGKEEEAGRFAGAIFGLLLAVAAALAILGVFLARPLVAIFATGYLQDAAAVAAGEATVDRFELAVEAIRWIFPMTGVLVLSAWALGVLNSHRRFFLPYFAPVLWNATMIGVVFWVAARGVSSSSSLVMAACVGALAGGFVQFAVQLPLVFHLLKGFRLSFSTRVAGVRKALRAVGPVVAGRGVVQLSLYLDHYLAALLAVGAVGAVRWGSFLYALPISLFGMSVAAAELPELSRMGGSGDSSDLDELQGRVQTSLRQILFLVIPTTIGYLAFGFLIVGAVYRTGEFGASDQAQVALVLGAYTLGLPASTSSRLLQNLFFALGDTKTPAKVAGLRVAIAAAVGAGLMFFLDRFSVAQILPVEEGSKVLYLGAVGLALGSALGSWIEIFCLRRVLHKRLEGFSLPWGPATRMVLLAIGASVPAALLWRGLLQLPWLPQLPWLLSAAVVVGLFAATYLMGARLLGFSESSSWLAVLRRRRG